MKTGVYQIRNKINGKRYIGSAAYAKRGFTNRWYGHRRHLNHGTHHSPHLQSAWKKYGASSFVFEILLYCDPKDCLTYEQIALDFFKPEYNVCQIAGSPLGYRHTAKARKAIGLASKGRRQSQSARLKISLSHRGEGCGSAKLTEEDVREIRLRIQNGEKQATIAEAFGISNPTITNIKNRHTWKHI